MANKENPTNPQILLQNAIQFIENNEFELASKILKEGQAEFPKEYSFINLLAQISLRNKKIVDGISLLKKSLQINPQQPLVMFDLGIAFSLNNQLDKAVIFFDKSIELEPRNLKVYIRKAITLRKLNRVKDSIDCYQKIIDLDPNLIDAYTNKAELLYSIGKFEESLYFYQQAIKI
jgi:tetratricopeptide (TPR) repeat protein